MDDLLKNILKFRNERDWEQYHTPRNLACSLSIEAAEVLEIFQWKMNEEISDQDKERLQEELADVFYYLLLLAHTSDIDLKKALLDKIRINAEKYPVEKSKGKSTKYTEL